MTIDYEELPVDAPAQVLPYDADAESGVIGSVLIDQACIDEVDITPDMFFLHRNSIIWECLLKLRGKRFDIDFISLSSQLRADNKLQDVGGDAYLARLITDTPTSLHIKTYANIIKDKAQRRKAIQVASEMVKRVYSNDDINSIYDHAVSQLIASTQIKKGAVHISKVLENAYTYVEERSAHPGDIWGIKTGFLDVDIYLGGLQKGDVLMLAGEPGVGKSKFAQQCALQMGYAGSSGAVYSLEMRERAVGLRWLSIDSEIHTRAMKSGRLADEQWAVFTSSVEKLSALPIYFSEKSELTLTELRADLTRVKYQHGSLDWMILDYMTLMSGFGDLSEIEKSTRISSGIHAICKDLDIAGIVINSTTKESIGAFEARMTDARGSAQVLFDADIIAIMKSTKQKNKVEISFTKGRDIDRPKGKIELIAVEGVPMFRTPTAQGERQNQEVERWYNKI